MIILRSLGKQISRLIILFVVICALLVPVSLFGSKVYVTDLNDSGAGTLRDAIVNASSGDTIYIDVAGTLELQSGITFNSDVIVIGPGAVHFTVDGNLLTGLQSGFQVMTGGSEFNIKGIRFANFSSCTVVGLNSSFSGDFNFYGCAFENNSNTVIGVDGGNIKFETCSFLNNSSPNEAGVCLFSGSTGEFTNCTFYNNTASFAGGAINMGQGTMSLTHNTFYENGFSMTPGEGKAIQVDGGTLNLRNNIIFNNSPSTDLIVLNTGTLISLGGNVSNDDSGDGGLPTGTDALSISVNSGISSSNMITDGWGITYFPPASGSAGIDIDATPSGLPTYDARRVWRVMDAGAGYLYADAGAVEYTPNTVTTQGFAPGSLNQIFDGSHYGTYVGNEAVVFEVLSIPTFMGGNGDLPASGLVLSKDNTLFNGFSQPNSVIPGPGSSGYLVTPAQNMPRFEGDFTSNDQCILINGNNVVVAGVEIGGFHGGGLTIGAGIRITGQDAVIEGTHLGIDSYGPFSNSIGIEAMASSSYFVGGFGYVGELYHNRRNVISGNDYVGLKSYSTAANTIQNTVFGLGVDGDSDAFGGVKSFSGDTCISFLNTSGIGNLVGGNEREDRNILSGSEVALYMESPDNKVFNNIIGLNFIGEIVSSNSGNANNYGIFISGANASNNRIGDVDRGNRISKNYSSGIRIEFASGTEIYSNAFGYTSSFAPSENTEAAIEIDNGVNTKIGEAGPRRNFICNTLYGDGSRAIIGYQANNTLILNNFIGLLPDSSSAPNNYAIDFYECVNTSIGAVGLVNYIGNTYDAAIVIYGTGNNSNSTMVGNFIGFAPTVSVPFGNSDGIKLENESGLTIGGTGAGEENYIWNTGYKAITTLNCDSIQILGNSMHNNGFNGSNLPIGIDLDNDDVMNQFGTPPSDNSGVTPPELLNAATCTNTSVELRMQNAVGEDYIVEFFKATAGVEGDTLLYRQTLSQVNAVDTFTVDLGAVFYGNIIATATRITSNNAVPNFATSEFSNSIYSSTIDPMYGYAYPDTVCIGTASELYVELGYGIPVWFSSNNLIPANRLGTGDYFYPLEAVAGTYNYWVVDSVAGCYGPVGDSVVVEVLDYPVLVGPDTICSAGSADYNFGPHYYQFGSYTFEWATNTTFPTSPNNGMDVNNPFQNSMFLSLGGAFDSGVRDTLIVILNSDGCNATDSILIAVKETPSISNNGSVDATSCGMADGQLYIGSLTIGEDYNLYYNGNTTPVLLTADASGDIYLTNLSAGSYLLDSVANLFGCSEPLGILITITEPPFPTITGVLSTSPTTCTGTDGTITVQGLDPGISYGLYYNGNTSPNMITADAGGNVILTNLVAGSYVVDSISNLNGCSSVISNLQTLVDPPSPILSAVSTDVTCNGMNDASVTVSALSGTAPYNYSINNGGTYTSTSFFGGLSGGIVQVVIQDANLCTSADTTITLNEPPVLSFGTIIKEDTCSRSVGSIDLVASGGIAPYQYSNDNGGSFVSTSLFANLPAASYDLVVLDANGCLSNVFATVNDLSGVSLAVSAYSPNVTCYGDSDGYIDIITTDPFGGVIYSWTEAASSFTASTEDISGLLPGDYTLDVIDAGSCTYSVPVTIGEPAQLLGSFGSVHETCDQLNDGSIYVQNITGGTGNVTTTWETNPGAVLVGTGDSLSTIAPDSYIGYLTDDNGCVSSGLVDVNPGESYTASLVSTAADSCINSNSFGFVDTNTPSSSAVSFSWSFTSAVPSTSVSSTPSGIVFSSVGTSWVYYSVTAGSGCVFSDSLTVNIYDTASIVLTPQNVSCFGANDGFVTASAVGGASPYMYSLNGGAITSTATITGLSSGTVTGYVVDAYGCQSNTSSTGVAEPSVISYSTTVVNTTCGVDNGSIDFINVTGGNGGYQYSIDGGSSYLSTSYFDLLSASTYNVAVQDLNGCVQTDVATVANSGNSVPTPTIDQVGSVSLCENAAGVYGTLTVTSNDVSPGTFTWYIGSLGGSIFTGNQLDLDNSNVGNYYIYVKESNGTCSSLPDSTYLDLTLNDVVLSYDDFCLGETTQINGTGSGSMVWYYTNGELDDTTSFNPIASPTSDSTLYYYEATIGSCIFYDSLYVISNPDCNNREISINAFSPDGDGVNDVFILDIPSMLSNSNTVLIVNRWGDEIRSFTNYNNTDVVWDGTSNHGEYVTNGTYFYIIEIPELDFKASGWIQVIR